LKQVIVARSDVKMGKGKLAAQVAHASVTAAGEASKRREEWYDEWTSSGQMKVVVKVHSEEESQELFRKARSAKLPAALIRDKGLTQVEPGTVTCLGIGPAPDEQIDVLTGKLKLL
jgi:PTH2 family peptidyl-tRNA hydrolase